MATRLFATDTDPAISPSVKGSWTVTTGNLAKAIDRLKADASVSLGLTQSFAAALFYRFVSKPLAGDQTIAGTLDAALMASRGSAGSGGFRFFAYVTQGDSTTLSRGTLLNIANDGAVWPTAEAGVQFSSVKALTSVSALDGDRIVIELGSQGASGSPTQTIRRGGTGADLTNGDTDTTHPGWFEFSQDLRFLGDAANVRAYILF